MGRKRGRPTKYSHRVYIKLMDYVDEMVKVADIPFKEQFCFQNDITVDNYDEWVKANPEFSRASRKLEALQKFMLMKGSIQKTYDSHSAVFQLKANHKMVETNILDVQSKGEKFASGIIMNTTPDVAKPNKPSKVH